MYSDLKGKTAVITGAASGLGHGIAKRFLEEGMNVVINYHSDSKQEAAEQLAAEFNGGAETHAVAVQADVSTEEGVRRLAEAAIDQFGGFDIWVNNAGIESRYETHELPKEAWDKMIAVNLTGTFLGAREALAHFVEQGKPGNIINMSSVHDRVPWPTFTPYAVSKAGVKMLTETIALEYAKRDIRVNCIAPGAIQTPINAEKFADPEAYDMTVSLVPQNRIGEVEDISSAAAWLASDASSYATGICLRVDGGMSLFPSFEEGDG